MAVHRILGLCSFLLIALFPSCSEKPLDGGKPIAKVNDYVITEADFCRELAGSAHVRNVAGLTPSDKKECLNGRIHKELLIQAAISRGLDREDEFRQSIESYWEQTLITTLLKREAARLEKEILVTKEEVEDHYRQMLQKDPGSPPFEQIAQTIEKNVREVKKTKAMENWMSQLRNEARIIIHEENLEALR